MKNLRKSYGFDAPLGTSARITPARLTVAGGALIGAVAVLLGIAATRAEQPDHWLDLYSAPRGSAPIEMKKRVRAGPFPAVAICYTVGALAIDAMNAEYPDRDFMARCDDGDLLDMRPMYDRAMQMLREEPKP